MRPESGGPQSHLVTYMTAAAGEGVTVKGHTETGRQSWKRATGAAALLQASSLFLDGDSTLIHLNGFMGEVGPCT